MKRYIIVLSIVLCPALWSCSSDSGGSPDPLASFRAAAEDLRQTAYDALIQTGRELDALPDADPLLDDYLIAVEDQLIGLTYSMNRFNEVIRFSIRSRVGTVYTNTDRDATIDVAGGRFVYESEAYIYDEADRAERVLATFTWDPASERWLIIGLRGGTADREPTDPWFRQEGEIADGTDYYIATTFFFAEEERTHISNLLLIDDTSPVSVQMACERPACTADCVDPDAADLFSRGITDLGLTLWDDFKTYAIEGADLPPDYEIP
ncbi:hypothetical protein JCM14469_19620 [Desulfatiferula olefinivorans]